MQSGLSHAVVGHSRAHVAARHRTHDACATNPLAASLPAKFGRASPNSALFLPPLNRYVRICTVDARQLGAETMSKQTLTAAENNSHAVRVREELARQRLSRDTLAARARVSLSTLEKGLSGQRPFTLATLVRLETALGLVLRAGDPAINGKAIASSHGNAPDDLGGYNRASVGWLEGGYLTLLPSFGERGSVYAFRTDISWDDNPTRLTFREAERLDSDFVQFGSVSVPLQSGHIYLITNRHGQVRLIMLARPLITGEMHGLLTTLQAGRGSHLTPASAPIVLKPLKPGEQPVYGRIRPHDPAFAAYRKLLRRTTADGFATFIPE